MANNETQSDFKPGQVRKDYILISHIGEGTFTNIWFTEHKLAYKNMGIKIIDHITLADEDSVLKHKRKNNMRIKMDHPLICQLYQIIYEQDKTILIMEFAENENLLDYLNQNDYFLKHK